MDVRMTTLVIACVAYAPFMFACCCLGIRFDAPWQLVILLQQDGVAQAQIML